MELAAAVSRLCSTHRRTLALASLRTEARRSLRPFRPSPCRTATLRRPCRPTLAPRQATPSPRPSLRSHTKWTPPRVTDLTIDHPPATACVPSRPHPTTAQPVQARPNQMRYRHHHPPPDQPRRSVSEDHGHAQRQWDHTLRPITITVLTRHGLVRPMRRTRTRTHIVTTISNRITWHIICRMGDVWGV